MPRRGQSTRMISPVPYKAWGAGTPSSRLCPGSPCSAPRCSRSRAVLRAQKKKSPQKARKQLPGELGCAPAGCFSLWEMCAGPGGGEPPGWWPAAGDTAQSLRARQSPSSLSQNWGHHQRGHCVTAGGCVFMSPFVLPPCPSPACDSHRAE